MEINVPPTSLCNNCGQCCKRMPGIYHPNQIQDEQTLVSMLKSGKFAIDWWEADEPTYYLRPAIPVSNLEQHYLDKGDLNVWENMKFYKPGLFHPSWGGQCVFLTDVRCDAENQGYPKPAECKALIPGTRAGGSDNVLDDRDCSIKEDGYDKLSLANAWKSSKYDLEKIGRSI